ncbi:hypothetical protein OHC33_009668 [Knufia fluminis]|uniref:Uncharacterized protein n=1 Tax=Knufia fluminis TaxID=191047 RepID=A0AAN8EAJ3_9EURO|nr:hypothetical protein OHC33_009668 [Knufia fluminis]
MSGWSSDEDMDVVPAATALPQQDAKGPSTASMQARRKDGAVSSLHRPIDPSEHLQKPPNNPQPQPQPSKSARKKLNAAVAKELDSLSLDNTTTDAAPTAITTTAMTTNAAKPTKPPVNPLNKVAKRTKAEKKADLIARETSMWRNMYNGEKEKREQAERRAAEAEWKVKELEGILGIDELEGKSVVNGDVDDDMEEML